MSLIINIYYTGKNGNARKFVEEMISKGIVKKYETKKEMKSMNTFILLMMQKLFF